MSLKTPLNAYLIKQLKPHLIKCSELIRFPEQTNINADCCHASENLHSQDGLWQTEMELGCVMLQSLIFFMYTW